ncbi:cytochrome P450 [Kitasatospora sp. GP82]|uniref:bifunctional cytochrome P450/NADPH--P450 reductase n=1 Tax=Kitasatospora sp. GP82 TaxID=3035089 RepID=UPI002474423A|nr:cytochrome P450 [Kitasatospora sp. GP82]MDH6123500.1 cytochrome P450/NADPH-cytochrome P450 reductase [Kitasatospora sp. GP82]
MTTVTGPEPIPGPQGLPVLGNIREISHGNPIENMMGLAREYGPIYRLRTPSGDRLIVSGVDLVDEVCDETRFDKLVGGGLANLRGSGVSTGLFSADTDDPLWHRAHNILMPPFGTQAMRDYLPMMLDLAGQLMDKWARLNPDDDVDVPADMTRLTLDTIALCGFGYRFNSFYRETPHPFVDAMVRTLLEAQKRARIPDFAARLRKGAQRRFEQDTAYMNATVDRIIQERRAAGDTGTRDLLDCMLTGVDQQSGERLPDENIRAQCITFLIAGHETTSGLLSFAVDFLLKHPEVVERARAEVDDVLGTDPGVPPGYEQVHRLTYVTQILEESLRLWPTAPAFNRTPYQDTVIGGRYRVAHGVPLTVLIPALHRDRQVWGADAEEFNPEHFSPQRRAGIPPNAFKPFGTGQRACIGRQFAMQEAQLVLGMLLQRFELIDHLGYRLKVKQTLTIKPDGLRIRVGPRAGRTLTAPSATAAPDARGGTPEPSPATAPAPVVEGHGTPLAVLFGSNLGTAEGIATQIAREGTERGFAVTLAPLDEHIGELPRQGAVVAVCSSYNGAPPDNAAGFCAWLRDSATSPESCDGVRYSVFGCGHSDWAATYQAVPKLIDAELGAHGAARVHPRGEGDARGDFDGQYRTWHAGLWPAMAEALALPAEVGMQARTGPRLAISMVNKRETNPVVVSYRACPAFVRVNRELQHHDGRPPDRSTRHLEIALPAGTTYQAGDHLGVLPRNSAELIWRVLLHFALDPGTYITITPGPGVPTHLPTGEAVPLIGVLASCVELQDVATRSDLETMAAHAGDPAQREELLALADDDAEGRARYQDRVFGPRRSVLDLLDEFPSCALPLAEYLDLLPPLRPRYYSISSSPLVSPEVCSITAGVVDAPARSGQGRFHGVCSTHLNESGPDSTVFAFVRKPTIPFRPTENPHQPMIMVGCGTGLAPFRGFLQERAAQQQQGVPVARSLLFFGCRNPEQDFLYEEELRGFEAAGIVRLRPAFSRQPGHPKSYVQHVIAQHEDEVWQLLQDNAVIFVCGDATSMAPDVRRAFTEVFSHRTGTATADAEAWLSGLRAADRYLEDIWGGG